MAGGHLAVEVEASLLGARSSKMDTCCLLRIMLGTRDTKAHMVPSIRKPQVIRAMIPGDGVTEKLGEGVPEPELSSATCLQGQIVNSVSLLHRNMVSWQADCPGMEYLALSFPTSPWVPLCTLTCFYIIGIG